MHLQFDENGDHLTVHVRCERLDASVSNQFKSEIGTAIRTGSEDSIKHVTLDLQQVEFVDSSALGSMVALVKLLGGRGAVTIKDPAPSTRSLLRLTRLDRVFKIELTEPV